MNLYTNDCKKILKVKVMLTVFNGHIVYKSSDNAEY
jgi:predicted amidohydrolase YtcJ